MRGGIGLAAVQVESEFHHAVLVARPVAVPDIIVDRGIDRGEIFGDLLPFQAVVHLPQLDKRVVMAIQDEPGVALGEAHLIVNGIVVAACIGKQVAVRLKRYTAHLHLDLVTFGVQRERDVEDLR